MLMGIFFQLMLTITGDVTIHHLKVNDTETTHIEDQVIGFSEKLKSKFQGTEKRFF